MKKGRKNKLVSESGELLVAADLDKIIGNARRMHSMLKEHRFGFL